MNKTALITGYTGQDGTFLTKHLLDNGYKVIALVRRISTEPPQRQRGQFDFSSYIDEGRLLLEQGDLLSRTSLDRIIQEYQPAEIYNLAAQSHVGTSFNQPEFTIEADFIGVVNLVESLIANNHADWKLYQASTSEMFGNTKSNQLFDESSRLDPRSPYAIAKTAAHHYCKMKREQGHYIVSGILFNHESEIRGGDFVTQKIARYAADLKTMPYLEPLELGNLDSGRDWGYAGDYVKAMHLMMQQEFAADYIVATGYAITVREFVDLCFAAIGAKLEWEGKGENEVGRIDGQVFVKVNPKFYRPNDVTYLRGNATRIKALGWRPEVDIEQMAKIMVQAAQIG